jgi:hypothetical protein
MTTNHDPRAVTEQIRELTVDEVDAVTGAGFWGDVWGGITDGVAGAFGLVSDFVHGR